jgi:hypothetical protein
LDEEMTLRIAKAFFTEGAPYFFIGLLKLILEYWSTGVRVECWISFYNTPILHSLQYSTIARLKDFGQPWIYLFIDSQNFFENTIGCHCLSTFLFISMNDK